MFGPSLSLTDMRFPFELSWSHRLLFDAGTIELLQENFDLDSGIACGTVFTDPISRGVITNGDTL